MSYDMPILTTIEYKCPICGFYARMERFCEGPANAHRWHYAIKCVDPMCPNHEVCMSDLKDSPSEAIRAWNRRAES
jgi:hypothetical protein